MSEKNTLSFPTNCLKNIGQRTCSRKGAITIGNNRMDQVCQGGIQPNLSEFSVSHSLHGAQRPLVYQLALPSPCQLPSSPWTVQATTPNTLFRLELRMVLKQGCLGPLAIYSVFLGLFHVSTFFNFCVVFSCQSVSGRFSSQSSRKNREGQRNLPSSLTPSVSDFLSPCFGFDRFIPQDQGASTFSREVNPCVFLPFCLSVCSNQRFL